MKHLIMIASAALALGTFACNDLDSGTQPGTGNHGGAGSAGELSGGLGTASGCASYLASGERDVNQDRLCQEFLNGGSSQMLDDMANSMSTMPVELPGEGPSGDSSQDDES